MRYLDDVTGHPQREDIERRVEIIKFFEDYGAEATKRAFNKSRSTVYLWKKKLKHARGKLSALAPGDRTPKNKRQRVIYPFIESYIIDYRMKHPGSDKTTITSVLKRACLSRGIKPVSESTVGRIIADLKAKGRLPRTTKLMFIGKTGHLLERESKPRKKLRRKGFVPVFPGDIVQMDSISVFTEGLKRYIFTAIDIRTRFAFAYTYSSHSSANGNDFLGKFLKVAPFTVKHIQTDNGSEFARYFDDRCQRNGLPHFFNYPKHPQANGHLERFNRTIQEQCVNVHEDCLAEPEEFNRKLMDYLNLV